MSGKCSRARFDRLLGGGNGSRSAVRLTRNSNAPDRCRPFPYVWADALHERVFDLSIFYRHSVESIVATRMVGDRVGLVTFQNTGCFDPFRAEAAFDQLMHSGNGDAAEMLRAMRSFLKENDMMAYLTMMAVRLVELHRVLRPTGALYIHCDQTASHYLRFCSTLFLIPETS